MQTETRTVDGTNSKPILAILAIGGVLAIFGAVAIAWPALSYLGAKLF